jgi:molybdopterin converting factor small subunit
MAVVTLRLFASAREAAGTGTALYDASTVSELLSIAENEFGNEFSQVLTISRVWLNGDPVEGDSQISNGDEVAVLPPVSGG